MWAGLHMSILLVFRHTIPYSTFAEVESLSMAHNLEVDLGILHDNRLEESSHDHNLPGRSPLAQTRLVRGKEVHPDRHDLHESYQVN